MGKMLVGPVVGKLTDTTVRVLIEVDKNQEVICNATDSKGKKIQQKKSFRKYQPSVFFTLQGLKPGTGYTITFSGVTNAREGKIKTFPKQPHRMNIAAVSCNFTIRRGDTNLWKDMLDRYINTGELDMVFHLGDQIYGDNTFEEALYILNGKPKGSKIKEGAILEAYRTLYRMT